MGTKIFQHEQLTACNEPPRQIIGSMFYQKNLASCKITKNKKTFCHHEAKVGNKGDPFVYTGIEVSKFLLETGEEKIMFTYLATQICTTEFELFVVPFQYNIPFFLSCSYCQKINKVSVGHPIN